MDMSLKSVFILSVLLFGVAVPLAQAQLFQVSGNAPLTPRDAPSTPLRDLLAAIPNLLVNLLNTLASLLRGQPLPITTTPLLQLVTATNGTAGPQLSVLASTLLQKPDWFSMSFVPPTMPLSALLNNSLLVGQFPPSICNGTVVSRLKHVGTTPEGITNLGPAGFSCTNVP